MLGRFVYLADIQSHNKKVNKFKDCTMVQYYAILILYYSPSQHFWYVIPNSNKTDNYVTVLMLGSLCQILTSLGHFSQKYLSSRASSVFHQLTKMNVEAQRMERELRDELAESVSKAVTDADRARITELEKAEVELRIEVSKYV